MKIYFLTFSFVISALISFSQEVSYDARSSHNKGINIAILDFLKNNKLSSLDTLFNVDVKQIDKKIFAVSIIGTKNKLYPTKKNNVGSNTPFFPTQCLEQRGKLFYWYDSTCYITNKLINIFSKYGLLDSSNISEIVKIPEIMIDDSKTGVHYYFCENNILKFKKVITNRALGWYKTPKMNCR